MTVSNPILITIVAAIVLAFVLGLLANRLGLPALAGFIIAGIVTGPHTGGLRADQALVTELYDMGLILLMFGAGLQFSVSGLRSVRHMAIPGALVLCIVTVSLCIGLGMWQHWSIYTSALFGLAMAAPSVVLMQHALHDRRLTETERGRLATGLLIVQSLIVVTVVLLLPVVGVVTGSSRTAFVVGGAFNTVYFMVGKVAMFALVMVLCGRYITPWLLGVVANTGSRELLRLAVIVIALGFALATAYVFGVAFALGAFFAGVMFSGAELSRRAALGALPFREVFPVLFFIAIGMMFDPSSVMQTPGLLLAILAIILLGKSLAAMLVVRLYRYSWHTAFTVAACLAQIGEFALVIASLGMALTLFSPVVGNLILTGAILSMLVNPLLITMLSALGRYLDTYRDTSGDLEQVAVAQQEDRMRNHVIVIGYGRVGSCVVEGLQQLAMPFIVIEHRKERVAQLRVDGMRALFGNAADQRVLEEANIAMAHSVIVVIPGAYEAAHVIDHALTLQANIPVVAYARTDVEARHLKKYGATHTVVGEHEIADAILKLLIPSSS